MNEPTPHSGEHVPDSVLDELKSAFGLVDDVAGDPSPTGGPVAATPVDAPAASASPAAPDAPAVAETSAVAEPAAPEPVATEPARPRPTIVIGGDDDELPDAVYLDDGEVSPGSGPTAVRGGAAGGTEAGERGTIVIGDELDSSGAFDAVEVPSRSMDPRVRARRIAVKRAQGRKRLLWAVAIGAAVLVVVGVLAVFASSLFAVDRVDVEGAVYTDPALLQEVIDSLVGEPVLLVDTMAAEERLEQIPWVERAFVRTDFPDRVVIDIRERRPLATFLGSDGRYRVIDRDGRVLDLLDGQPVDYMLLTGPAPDTEPGQLAGTPFAYAAQMVGALPAEIRDLTVSASVDATTGDLGLELTGPVEVRIGTVNDLDGKLARLLQLVRDGLDGVTRIDVSTDEVSVTRG